MQELYCVTSDNYTLPSARVALTLNPTLNPTMYRTTNNNLITTHDRRGGRAGFSDR